MTSCLCTTPDARACLTTRYPEPMLLTGEVCGCACHGEAPTGVPVIMPAEQFRAWRDAEIAALLSSGSVQTMAHNYLHGGVS